MATPFRLRALERARKYVGVKETPPGSNHGTLIDQWCFRTNGLRGGYPWCAAFMWCMFDDVGLRLRFTGPALVENWVRWGRTMGYVVVRPRKGDVCCFDWSDGGDGWRDHIGLVDRVLALRFKDGLFVGWVRSVEGNTSSSDAGSQSNGGQVAVRWRWVNGRQVYLRIPGP